jgi:hypothetical protein
MLRRGSRFRIRVVDIWRSRERHRRKEMVSGIRGRGAESLHFTKYKYKVSRAR